MIRSINIENFKSIEKSGEIEIAPITLIMGPNSSGKSAILKPLLLMKQTADSRDVQRSVQVDGTYVELGLFHQFAYNHDDRKEVSFTITFTPKSSLLWRTAKKEIIMRKRSKYVTRSLLEIVPEKIVVEVAFGSGAYQETITKKVSYTLTDNILGKIFIQKTRGAKGAYSGLAMQGNEITRFTPQRKSKFYDIIQSPKVIGLVPISRSELGYNLPRLLSYLTRSFEIIISKIVYLGPLREEPEPLYGASSERPQDVGKAGEDAPSVLWIGRGEKKQIELKKKVEKWMNEFEIARTIKLHKLGPFFQMFLTDWHSGIKSNLPDIGFGASQLLPVIVAGYYAPEESLLIAEQPEIHLHPKAQTKLGDLFIDISNHNKQLLVETHSEHILMRIQRRVADKTISNKRVALYYCEPSKRGTSVRRINLDEYGQLQSDLPPSFFEESYLESKAHLEAMIARKSK